MPGVPVGFLLAIGGCYFFAQDPFGGEPAAVVATIMPAPPQPELPAAKIPDPPEPNAEFDASATTPANVVTIIDGMTGRRQEIVIGPNPASGAQTLPARPLEDTTQKASRAMIEARLVEMSRHGPIPKIGPDGTRAAALYAQPLKLGAQKPGPRVAIVLEALGVAVAATSEAVAKLPAPITFAFSPYGADLPRWVDRAREAGHEILLQLPMEPSESAGNDPSSRGLKTSLAADLNLDRLHWFMSRFSGYVGVAITSSAAAAGPVVTEIGRRGLMYFEDGRSLGRLAGQLCVANNGTCAKADVVLDAVTVGAAIDTALLRLEALARERGSAVGVAGAAPVAIDRISQWAKTAEARGVILVPISMISTKPKSP
jgi:uncharacterized protein